MGIYWKITGWVNFIYLIAEVLPINITMISIADTAVGIAIPQRWLIAQNQVKSKN